MFADFDYLCYWLYFTGMSKKEKMAALRALQQQNKEATHKKGKTNVLI